MSETTNPAVQRTLSVGEASINADADVLRAADAWQVEGFSVWDAVKLQIAAEMPEPSPFRAEALRQSIYETHAGDEPAESAARLAEMLAKLEETQPDAVAQARLEANRIPTIDPSRHKPEPSAIAVVPAEIARAHRVVPIRKLANKLWVAMENPLDTAAIDAVRMASRCQVIPMRALPEGTLDDALAFAYPEADATEAPAEKNVTAELIALVRDLQNEVRELKHEVQDLKKQVAARQAAPPTPDARPAAYPAPSAFQMRPAVQPLFPLFRD